MQKVNMLKSRLPPCFVFRVLQHPNLLQCLGQCVEAIPFLLVFEYSEMVSVHMLSNMCSLSCVSTLLTEKSEKCLSSHNVTCSNIKNNK